MAHELNGFTYEWIDGQANAARTLVLLHGTGGDEQSLLGLGRELDAKAAVLSPRGGVRQNGTRRFLRRLGEEDFDLEDLKPRTHELADFLDAAVAWHGVGEKPITVVGYSNGGSMAAALLLLRPEVLSEAVLLRAKTPIEPDHLPDLTGKRALLLAGQNDPIAPEAHTRRLAELLQEAGAAVEHHVEPAGHEMEPDDLARTVRWLHGRVADEAP